MLFPFFIGRVAKLVAPLREGLISGLYVANRIGQYILILQFVSGGLLIYHNSYSSAWIVTVIAVFTILAAFAGLMAQPMRDLMNEQCSEQRKQSCVTRLRVYGVLISICFIILVILMKFTTII